MLTHIDESIDSPELPSISTRSSPSTVSHLQLTNKQSSKGKCGICPSPSAGNHFGAEACRSCAAFFRRAVRSSRELVCRQGDHSCMKTNPNDLRCKKCRYTLCIKVGMNIATKNDLPDIEIEEESKIDKDPLYPFVVSHIKDSSNSFLLERIRINYRKLIERRIESEKTVITQIPPSGKQATCSYAELNAIMRAAFPLIAHFACTTFPELCDLQSNQKIQLLKHFAISLFYLESYNRTSIIYELTDSRRSLTHLTCMDLDNLNDLTFGKEGAIAINEMIRSRSFRPRIIEMNRQFKRLSLSEIELSSMIALVLSSHECSNMDDTIISICKPIKDSVISELNKHYADPQSHSSKDPARNAMRMGDILSFFSEFQFFSEEQKRDHYLMSMFTESNGPGFLLSLTDNQ